jgi:hypothetical protein
MCLDWGHGVLLIDINGGIPTLSAVYVTTMRELDKLPASGPPRTQSSAWRRGDGSPPASLGFVGPGLEAHPRRPGSEMPSLTSKLAGLGNGQGRLIHGAVVLPLFNASALQFLLPTVGCAGVILVMVA